MNHMTMKSLMKITRILIFNKIRIISHYKMKQKKIKNLKNRNKKLMQTDYNFKTLAKFRLKIKSIKKMSW